MHSLSGSRLYDKGEKQNELLTDTRENGISMYLQIYLFLSFLCDINDPMIIKVLFEGHCFIWTLSDFKFITEMNQWINFVGGKITAVLI